MGAASPCDDTNVEDFASFPLENWEDGSVKTILYEVTQITSKQFKVPVDQLTPDTSLPDLGAQSLDLIEIIFALEEKFDINIPFNANEAAAGDTEEASRAGLGKFETIAQISAEVKRLIDANSSA